MHYTDNTANPGASVARTPFLIEDILYQHNNSLKIHGNGIKQNGGNNVKNNNCGNGSNNNNNGKVNGNSDSSVSGNKSTRGGSEVIPTMHPTEEEYRKLLQSER